LHAAHEPLAQYSVAPHGQSPGQLVQVSLASHVASPQKPPAPLFVEVAVEVELEIDVVDAPPLPVVCAVDESEPVVVIAPVVGPA
jgi:hypothetical protein